MAITAQECESIIDAMSDGELSTFLAFLGHELTIVARSAYEFQGPGVTDPRLLRDLNEIQHRVFGQLMALNGLRRSKYMPAASLVSWLLGEDRSARLRFEVEHAFGRALKHSRAAA